MANTSELKAQLEAQYNEAVKSGDYLAANKFAEQAQYLNEQSAQQPVDQPVAQEAPQGEPGFMQYAGQAAQQIPRGFMELVSRGNPEELGRGLESAGAALSSPSFIRTAPTIAVGLASTGVGLVPAALMAGTAAVSETFAEYVERETGKRKEMEPRKIAAAAAYGGAPIIRFSQPVSIMSPGAASFIASATSSAVAGETGRAIEAGKVFPPSEGKLDAAMRFTTPFISGAAARMGSRLEGTVGRAEQISQARGGGGMFNPDGTIANVLFSEANPEFIGMEARNIANGNARAIDRMIRTDDNMANVAMSLVEASPENTPIAKELMGHMGLNNLREQSIAAKEVADKAQEAARRARLTYSSDSQKLVAEAEAALREKMRTKAAFDQGLSKVLGPKLPSLFQIDPKTVALEIKDVADDATKAVKLARSGLYDATGIQINDAVVGLDEVLSRASSASKSGGVLQGKNANSEFMEAIASAFGDKSQLTREEFLEFKTMYAKKLASGSSDPKVINAAERKAAEQYNVLKDAANDYVGKKYGVDIQNQWKAANNAYAQSVSALDSDVVSLLSNQDFEGFFKLVKDGGKNSPAWRQLNQYADFLSGVSKKAIESGAVNPADLAIADNFRQHIYAGMMKGMLDSSLVDGARKASKIAGSDAIDAQKFVKNIAELETLGEFPVKEVFGANATEFRRLARFIDKKFDGHINQTELTEWLSMLPKSGVDLATQRLVYRKSVQKAMLETDFKVRNAALRKAESEANLLNKNADALQAEFRVAASDPITRFFSDTNFKIDPNDYVNNSKLVQRIVQEVEPSVIKKFVESAKASGKSDLVDEIGKVAAADAVRRFIPTQYEGTNKLKLRELTDLFYSSNEALSNQRENLRIIIGKDKYDVIKRQIVDPISDIIRGREAIQAKQPTAFNDVRALATIYGGAQGNITGGAMAAQGGNNILKAADKGMYNLLTQIYLNPKIASKLQSVGYDLTKFAQLSPVYSAQVNAALAKDAQTTQGKTAP
jgi:hypothetical protein